MSSDAELIERSLRGDNDAFVEVISRHENAIGNYLARRVGRQAAEDVLSEVWVAAYESRANYDRSYPVARPWLFGVALNKVRRYWTSEPVAEAVPDFTDAKEWDPWSEVDVRVDAQALLRRALARLKPEEREVLGLVAWEDLTVAEAGRVLDIPAGTARRLLHQARKALRAAPEVAALLEVPTT
ncbi:RNA polymerase sigma factor [Lentzea sp. NPDC060358]|uniref:RNA polymerase sigma factor n=1 Tax=Lentzea sp. NPDC060358 TaxID=3347103 RepID=UPI0036484A7B